MNIKPVITTTSVIADIRMRIAIAIAALLSLYYRLPLLFLLLALIFCYQMWGYYWTLMSSRLTGVHSKISHHRIFAGESFFWDLHFSNGWFLPIVRCGISVSLPHQLSFSCSVPASMSVPAGDTGSAVTSDKILPLWSSCILSHAWENEKQDFSIRLQVKSFRRGIYYLPPAHFFTGDPSGLFRGMGRILDGEYLYVFPRPLNTEELSASKVLADCNRDANVGLEDRYQIQGVRDYQLTDPLKSVNWYATARTGGLKSNLYQCKDSEYCLVVFDLSTSYQPLYDYGIVDSEDPLLEEAISTAAGIALYHLERGAKTAFLTNSPLTNWVGEKGSPADGKKSYMKRIQTLSSIDYAEGEEQAQRILELCAAIDGSNRAGTEEQRSLWVKLLRGCRPGTLVYLLGYHSPPESWEGKVSSSETVLDPFGFYTPERIGNLPTSKVRLLNLSQRVEEN